MSITTTPGDETSAIETRKKEPCGCRGCAKPVATLILWRFPIEAGARFILAGACPAHLAELRGRGPASEGPGGRVGREFAEQFRVEREEYDVACAD